MINLNIRCSVESVGHEDPPFDMIKAIKEALSTGGFIYIHPILFDSVYAFMTRNIDKPYSIDPCIPHVGNFVNIVATDLLPENEYRVLTESEFNRIYNYEI